MAGWRKMSEESCFAPARKLIHETCSLTVIASVSEAIQLGAAREAGWLRRKELLAMTGPTSAGLFRHRFAPTSPRKRGEVFECALSNFRRFHGARIMPPLIGYLCMGLFSIFL